MLCVNTCSNFYVNSTLEIKARKMWTDTCVQLLANFGPRNQTYLNLGDHVPTQNRSNHFFYWLKWATRNSRPTPGLPGLPGSRWELVDPVRFLDPLGGGPKMLWTCTIYVFQLLVKFGPGNQKSENVRKRVFHLLVKFGRGNQISLSLGDHFAT